MKVRVAQFGRNVLIEEYDHDRGWENEITGVLGPTWSVERWSYWLVAHPEGGAMPDQGFKLHVAPDYPNIDRQLRHAVRVLARHRCGFKVNADMKIVGLMNTKLAARASSGKFITIYPNSHEQFLELAAELREELSGFHGPYILTDRRIPGSGCVFYRYGGFRRMERSGGDGVIISLIKDNDGNFIEDKRLPVFILPPGVEDPFPQNAIGSAGGGALLNNRYQVTSSFGFNNGGGVYRAIDTLTDTEVVIKEGRPFAGLRLGQDLGSDAVSAIRGEAQILQRLAGIDGVAVFVEYFEAWEHVFLVEKLVPYATWYSAFAADELILLPFAPGHTNVKAFLRVLVPLLRDAIRIFSEIHARGIAIGDVSARNIMVDSVGKRCYLIDLETAYELAPQVARSWRTELHTPGYRRAGTTDTSLTGYIDGETARLSDWYGLAMCVVEAAMPITSIAYMKDMSANEISELVTARCGLPMAFQRMLLALFDGNIEESMDILDHLQDRLDNHLGKLQEDAAEALDRARMQRKAMSLDGLTPAFMARIGAGIVGSYKGPGGKTLWKVDPLGGRTNKLSISHGASGILTGLRAIDPDAAAEKFDTLLRGRHIVGEMREHGLYLGSAGVAATQAMFGDLDAAVGNLAALKPYLDHCPSFGLFDGSAGIGLAALSVYAATNDRGTLELAARCYEHVKTGARTDATSGNVYWLARLNSVTNPFRDMEKYKDVNPEQVNYGFGNGLAGIAYFLAHYQRVTKDREARRLSAEAIRTIYDMGCRLDGRGRPQWGVDQVDPRMMPYWFDGAAGIGGVLCRMSVLLEEQSYLDLAVQLVDSAFTAFAVSPGQKTGVAGIVEFLTDVYQATGSADVLGKRDAAVTGLLTYALDAPDGSIAFPGELCQQECFDYATGTTGIALALNRVLVPGPNPFFDFELGWPSGQARRTRATSKADAMLDGAALA